MRGFLILVALPLLGGCLSFDGRTGPGKTPHGADGVGYTEVPAAELAGCIGSAIGVAAAQDGSTYTIQTSMVSYRAEPTTSAGSYPTRLVVRGRNGDAAQVIAVNRCLAPR